MSNNRIKVLLVHNYYREQFRGGEDIVYEKECAALGETENIDLYTYTCSNDEVTLPFYNAFYSRRHNRNIRNIIREHNIDILHIHNIFLALTPSIIETAKDCGCKVIQTVHNYRWFCPNGVIYNPHEKDECRKCFGRIFPISSVKYKCNYNSHLKSFYIACINAYANMRNISDMIDRFIVMTDDSRHVLQSAGVNGKRIVMKPHFIEKRLKRKTEKTGNYLFIGRVDRLKGIYLLVEAAIRTGVQLYIVGEGPDSENVKHICARNSNIHFLGIVEPENIFEYIYKSDFLIMPSLMHETFGLTIIESMSAGVPVMGSALGSRMELINSSRGILFEPDIDSLVSAINMSLNMSDTDYDKMSESAFEYAQQFNKKDNIKRLIEIYRDVL